MKKASMEDYAVSPLGKEQLFSKLLKLIILLDSYGTAGRIRPNHLLVKVVITRSTDIMIRNCTIIVAGLRRKDLYPTLASSSS